MVVVAEDAQRKQDKTSIFISAPDLGEVHILHTWVLEETQRSGSLRLSGNW